MKNEASVSEIYLAIITGLAAAGEITPETLGEKGGAERVKILTTHATNLAKTFHGALVKSE